MSTPNPGLHLDPSYAELHLHTAYSLLDGAALPEEIVARAAELGYRHLAVTENGKITGIISVRDLLHYFKVYYGGIGSLKKKKS